MSRFDETYLKRTENDLYNAVEELDKLQAENAALKAQVAALREIVDEYAEHSNRCILSQWQQGEPTPDGGYRTMFAGKWYQVKPVDETPKCNCGLSEALQGAGEER